MLIKEIKEKIIREIMYIQAEDPGQQQFYKC